MPNTRVVVHTCGRPLVVIAGGCLCCCAGPPDESSVHGVTIACLFFFICSWSPCWWRHNLHGVLLLRSSNGGVVLDCLGVVVCSVLGDVSGGGYHRCGPLTASALVAFVMGVGRGRRLTCILA